MKLEQLQKLAKDKKITLVCMLPEEARTSILRRAMFTADCNEYHPDYDRIIGDVDNCTLAELEPLFEEYKKALEQFGETDENFERQYLWYSDRIKNHNATRKPEITEADRKLITAVLNTLVTETKYEDLVQLLGSIGANETITLASKLKHWDYLEAHNLSSITQVTDFEDVYFWENDI